ncbi:MAG TPA: glucose-1-phosphate adenylyltransferase [Acidimicrobiales bacterium]|nr:glucose-1-phosphate adenylyltransferase [Acidimicrobiales bacterium]
MDYRSERPRVLSMVLAGGEGKRLAPLTLDRAKPAVPFGGHYRLIDFALSNLANGGYRRMVVLTQYKSHSLDVHISRTWRMAPFLGDYVTSVPAQMRRGRRWFLGSADAIYQNFNLIDDEEPNYIFVFGSDHVYRMDPSQMLDHHIASGAGITVAAIRVPLEQAPQFGVIEVGKSSKIDRFLEKPIDAVGLADSPHEILASMGNYVFDTQTLVDIVNEDALDETSAHDIGGDLLPKLVKAGVAHVYDFTTNVVPGETERDRHYWRDVGTLDSYYDAHMDLVAPLPVFNLYNDRWPVYTLGRTLPPAKIVFDGALGAGEVYDSLLCNGAIVSGAAVRRSVVSPGVRVEAGARVEGAILLDDAVIGPGAIVRNAIIDKNVLVPPGAVIGVDLERDAERFTVSPCGVVAIAKGQPVEK